MLIIVRDPWSVYSWNYVVFLLWCYYVFAFVRLSPNPPPLSSINFEMSKFWDTHSFMHQYRCTHNVIAWRGDVKLCYKGKHDFVRPTGYLASKHDFSTKLCRYQCIWLLLFVYDCRLYTFIWFKWFIPLSLNKNWYHRLYIFLKFAYKPAWTTWREPSLSNRIPLDVKIYTQACCRNENSSISFSLSCTS